MSLGLSNLFTMHKTLEKAYEEGIAPYAQQISEEDALTKTAEPFRTFMLANKRLRTFMDIADVPMLKSQRKHLFVC